MPTERVPKDPGAAGKGRRDAMADLERRLHQEDREEDQEFAEYVRERKAENYKWPNLDREGW